MCCWIPRSERCHNIVDVIHVIISMIIYYYDVSAVWTLKEHSRLYFNDENGTWIRFRGKDDHSSHSSSPLCVSLRSNLSLEPPNTSHADMSLEDETLEIQFDKEFESSK